MSARPVPLFDHPRGEKNFTNIQSEFPMSKFVTVASPLLSLSRLWLCLYTFLPIR